DLMRLFGSERIARLMDRMGAQDGEVLTHPLITRSIEQAQKRVELQNFQARKRLLEYDDVMNQQREVIYSLRSFALEGGEELKGEALKMLDRALERRVEKNLETYDSAEEWDFPLLRQELLMHFLLSVPELEDDAETRPTTVADAQELTRGAGRAAFQSKLTSLGEYADQLLSLVMLNVIDEKWKDHLYDLDQLRAAIHYRSWGQKDPLVEYKQDAYTMFVDLMEDIHNTFAERFLRVQLVFNAPEMANAGGSRGGDGSGRARGSAPRRPTKRYNALGILEDVPEEEPAHAGESTAANGGDGRAPPEEVLDIGPDQPPKEKMVAKHDPVIVGAGRARSLSSATASTAAAADWSSVGRNDPCPCGSGKKFKKCHGAAVR
ncbi:MAG TPA: SEC-C metal-binding domain-containing protein, partial [Gemmatimonadaceae bacterium]|nr:SEC-C metal-binding domain-containing protein [Gemmatimonadaceae bacterium]